MKVVVDPAPARWHPALAPIRKQLVEAAQEHEGYKAVIEKQAGKPEARWPESARTCHWPRLYYPINSRCEQSHDFFNEDVRNEGLGNSSQRMLHCAMKVR